MIKDLDVCSCSVYKHFIYCQCNSFSESPRFRFSLFTHKDLVCLEKHTSKLESLVAEPRPKSWFSELPFYSTSTLSQMCTFPWCCSILSRLCHCSRLLWLGWKQDTIQILVCALATRHNTDGQPGNLPIRHWLHTWCWYTMAASSHRDSVLLYSEVGVQRNMQWRLYPVTSGQFAGFKSRGNNFLLV